MVASRGSLGGPHDTVQGNGFRDALEPPPASRLEADIQVRAGQSANGLADQHLTRLSLCTDPNGDVDGATDDALRRVFDLTGVHADADHDPMRRLACVFPLDRGHNGEACLNRIAHRIEHHVEGVAFGPDLRPPEGADHLADDAAIAAQQLTSGSVAVTLGVRGVPPKIAEQEGSCLCGHGTNLI